MIANGNPSLAEALARVTAGVSTTQIRSATTRLIDTYRSGSAPPSQVLADPVSALAYAAYRMPATYAAVSRALTLTIEVAPDLSPASLVDLGGGTGAASWAAAAAFPSVREVTVVDGSAPALALGQRIAAGAAVLGSARWVRRDLTDGTTTAAADLALVSYVLGELSPTGQESVLDEASRSALVVVVEPGTPRGYAAVLAARERLRARGWSVVAPCPHDEGCPLVSGDWCHLAARLTRTAIHRDAKGAARGHEDEKLSFVAMHREPVARSGARVLRHPVTRTGMVSLQLCRADGSAGGEIVSKRQGTAYRQARDVRWGDLWPPHDS